MRFLKNRCAKERTQLSSEQLRAVMSLIEQEEDQHGEEKMHSGWGAVVYEVVSSNQPAKMVLEFMIKIWASVIDRGVCSIVGF